MKYICPLITVNDIKKAKDFYENKLKQKVKVDFGENVTFEGDFAIHLKSHFKKLINNLPIQEKSNNFELYFEDENIEEIVNDLKKIKTEFIHDIREQPWRQKVVRFYDPDSNIIEIGEPLEHVAYRLDNEGLSINEISKITYLPEDIVEKGIKKYNKLNLS